MDFSLIICTYRRPESLKNLLFTIKKQALKPMEIIVVDGSEDSSTAYMLSEINLKNLFYFHVDHKNRGLTQQRNFGLNKVQQQSEVVCFLDDDIILEEDYFKNLLDTYLNHPDALGVGGYITNEVSWHRSDYNNNNDKFYYDGWIRKEPLRFRIRNLLGLAPDRPPCYLPTFSHGRSVSFLPPSSKTYPVDLFMGGVSSYRRYIFNDIKFSTYFEGYGLYEDADFCLRLSKKGQLYVNTAARLAHYHEASGRPNHYKYGKMVINNGWYVWRIKFPNPSVKTKIKWRLTSLLLIILTFARLNIRSFKEGSGRLVSWLLLFVKKPKLSF